MKTALPAFSGDVFELTPEVFDAGLDAAHASPRRRIIFPIHRRPESLVQRMLNFMLPGTYVRPHLHPRDEAIETVQVLRGALGFVMFGDEGGVRSRHRLDTGGLIDIEPGLWHGLVVLAPDTVILEIKRGPYDAARDKVFADWAPAEGDAAAATYLESLAALFD